MRQGVTAMQSLRVLARLQPRGVVWPNVAEFPVANYKLQEAESEGSTSYISNLGTTQDRGIEIGSLSACEEAIPPPYAALWQGCILAAPNLQR